VSRLAVDAAPRVAIVTCGVLEEEIRHLAHDLEHVVHLEVLEQGLHNEPDRLRVTLQDAIGRVEAGTDAEVIVLGYGLCGRGTEGVRTDRSRLVIPRAHDCITLLLGCRQRYAEYVAEQPGTYWYSPGWIRCHVAPGEERYRLLRRYYVEKYGEDNADYLMEQEQVWFDQYDNAAFVDLGVGDIDGGVRFTRECADWLGWRFDRQCGDPDLLRTLLTGPWPDDRFVTLEPGRTFRMTADDRVLDPVPAGDEPPAVDRGDLLNLRNPRFSVLARGSQRAGK
jgi:hypothetical protein